MAEIKILSSNIYNKIAAGEVVERPASIIKELLDNSIDAGANEISIEIIGGGIKKMIIKDNGCGIEKQFIKTAFLRHATSKIKIESDLFNIKTLGFRGEALSSIAAVSMVNLKSKTLQDETGSELTIHGGEILNESEIGMNNGTIFTIENLFYNTPVRLKFLKTPKSEESEITSIVSRYILANPSIKISYKADSRTIFNSYGKDLKEAIAQIYGRDLLEQLVFLDYSSHGYNLSGYICKPNFSKANRTYQTLIVNGRYVINSTISSAITLAYNEFLMKRQYPFFILSLKMPSDSLDVNVHPNKIDVRFEDNKKIFSLFYNAINNKLLEISNSNNIKDITKPKLERLNFTPITNNNENLHSTGDLSNELGNHDSFTNGSSHISGLKPEKTNYLNINEDNTNTTSSIYTQSIIDRYNKSSSFCISSQSNISDVKINNNYFSDETYLSADIVLTEDKAYINKKTETIDDQIYKSDDQKEGINNFFNIDENNNINKLADQKGSITDNILSNTPKQGKFSFSDNKSTNIVDLNLKICGTLFNTFILVESNNICYIIDQHAGHERLLYDKFIKSYNSGETAVQDLLVPYIFSVSPQEEIFFEAHSKHLADIGFGIDNFGDFTYRIFCVPAQLSSINLLEFIKEILDENSISKTIDDINFLKEKIIQKACKAAVKAGDKLSESEINILISNLLKNTVLLCPHGRPVITTISKYELEKMFKRVV